MVVCVVPIGCPYDCCDIYYDCAFTPQRCYYYPQYFPLWIPLTIGFSVLVCILIGIGSFFTVRRRRIIRLRERNAIELGITGNSPQQPIYGSPVYQQPQQIYEGQPYYGQMYEGQKFKGGQYNRQQDRQQRRQIKQEYEGSISEQGYTK